MKVDEALLKSKGFTNSGADRFRSTVAGYAQELFDRSVLIAQATKAKDSPLEITHEHVRESASIIASTFGSRRPPAWATWLQVLEYVCTFTGGVGASNALQAWGVIVLVLSAVVCIACWLGRQNAQR